MNPLFGGSTKKPVVKKSTTKKPLTVKKSSTKKPVVKKSTTKKTASKRKASGIDTDELIAGKKRKTLHRKRAGSDELIAGKKRKRAGSDELIAGEVSKEEMTSGKKHVTKLKKEFAKSFKAFSDNFKKNNKGNLSADEIRKHLSSVKKSTLDSIKYKMLEAESHIYSSIIDEIKQSY